MPGDDGGRKRGQNWRDRAAEQGLRGSTRHERAGQVALRAAPTWPCVVGDSRQPEGWLFSSERNRGGSGVSGTGEAEGEDESWTFLG